MCLFAAVEALPGLPMETQDMTAQTAENGPANLVPALTLNSRKRGTFSGNVVAHYLTMQDKPPDIQMPPINIAFATPVHRGHAILNGTGEGGRTLDLWIHNPAL